MLSARGNSSKVLTLLFLIQHTMIFTHNIFVQINVQSSISKSSRTALTVHEEGRSTVKEETSFCSVSFTITILLCLEARSYNYYFVLRMVVLTSIC